MQKFSQTLSWDQPAYGSIWEANTELKKGFVAADEAGEMMWWGSWSEEKLPARQCKELLALGPEERLAHVLNPFSHVQLFADPWTI